MEVPQHPPALRLQRKENASTRSGQKGASSSGENHNHMIDQTRLLLFTATFKASSADTDCIDILEQYADVLSVLEQEFLGASRPT